MGSKLTEALYLILGLFDQCLQGPVPPSREQQHEHRRHEHAAHEQQECFL